MADSRLRALQRAALLDPTLEEASARAHERTIHPPYTADEFNDFVMGYLECAIWAAPEDDDGNNLDEYSPEDFTDDARAVAERDCDAFLRATWDDLTSSAVAANARRGCAGSTYTTAELHGHDFYLTRNGHGVGFWDRGYGDAGKRLTAACKLYRENPAWAFGDDNERSVEWL